MHPTHIVPIAEQWRREVAVGLEWRPDEERTRRVQKGEAGGFVVGADGFPYFGWSKPTKICPDDEPRAANEKLSYDLAYDLGLAVPPVTLFNRDCSSGEEGKCCVSLFMFDQMFELGQLVALQGVDRSKAAQAIREGSGIVSFDAWIGNRDRSQRNVLIGYDSATGRWWPAFIDHAFALNSGNQWNGAKWKDVRLSNMPSEMRAVIDKGLALATAGRIAGITDKEIGALIDRIPSEYMTSEQRSVVLEGLSGRRGLVSDVLKSQLT